MWSTRRHGLPHRREREVPASPSELLYLVDDDFQHPVTRRREDSTRLASAGPGPGGPNLDYIRGKPLRRGADAVAAAGRGGSRQRPRRPAGPLRAAGHSRSGRAPLLLRPALGARSRRPDKVFGFRPGNGVHDIHMNQGNSRRLHSRRRRVAGRRPAPALPGRVPLGGHLPRLPEPDLAHRRQHRSRHRRRAPAPTTEPVAIQILAAMANPVGPAPERETVLLLNASPQSVDLTGWRLADRLKHSCPLPAGPLAAGATLEVAAQDGSSSATRAVPSPFWTRRG